MMLLDPQVEEDFYTELVSLIEQGEIERAQEEARVFLRILERVWTRHLPPEIERASRHIDELARTGWRSGSCPLCPGPSGPSTCA